jgi:uncharacterized SAM-binding protein YcdF (DUF218 family)
MRVLARTALWLGAAAVACWLAGFFWFGHIVRRPAGPPPAHADGIVALTGGAGRVELALHLLANGQADRLLVSGIGGHTDLQAIGRFSGVDTAALANRVALGRFAASTRGNAVETAAWAEQNRIGSLIVVTSAYHMPRALAELHMAIPAVSLYPQPVGSGDMGMRLAAEEYSKYVLTVSGLSVWLPSRTLPSVAQPAGVGS